MKRKCNDAFIVAFAFETKAKNKPGTRKVRTQRRDNPHKGRPFPGPDFFFADSKIQKEPIIHMVNPTHLVFVTLITTR